MDEELMKVLLRYGDWLTDDMYEDKNSFVRIRTIAHQGIVYYLRMRNGYLDKLKILKGR